MNTYNPHTHKKTTTKKIDVKMSDTLIKASVQIEQNNKFFTLEKLPTFSNCKEVRFSPFLICCSPDQKVYCITSTTVFKVRLATFFVAKDTLRLGIFSWCSNLGAKVVGRCWGLSP